MDLKIKILEFLHQQLNKNNLTNIRKGMCEDVEAFILSILAEVEEQKVANKMVKAEPSKEE